MAKMKATADNGRVRTRHLGDYTTDPNNLRVHNPRNIGVIADALQEVGTGRSLVVDENDVILAGNGVSEAAGEVGITKVLEVEADGDELVVVKRRGLTDDQKRALAIYDNRAGELSTWNASALSAALLASGATQSANAWHEDEIARLANAAAFAGIGDGSARTVTAPGEFPAYDENLATDHKCPKCGYEWS
jgi:ParB-like chromosome segregation protein Spo0J